MVLRAVQALHMFFNFLLDVFARIFCAALTACVGVLLFGGQSAPPDLSHHPGIPFLFLL